MDSKIVFSGGAEEGDRFFYHFDYETFLRAATNSENQGRRYYLSLGDTFHEWHERTAARRVELYNQILTDSVVFLRQLNPLWNTVRHAEILIGHLVRLVSFRISRAEGQLSLIPALTNTLDLRVQVAVSNLPPSNFSESYSRIVSGTFDNLIEARCVADRFSKSLEVELVPGEVKESLKDDQSFGFLERLYLSLGRVLRPLTKGSRILVAGTYLGRGSELLLQLLLRTPPVLSDLREPDTNSKTQVEAYFFNGLANASCSASLGLEIVRSVLPEFYLRSHSDQEARWRDLGWPKTPKIIFTSNNFVFDAEFMAYLANRASTVQYFVGQHGNNYGVSQDMEPIPEVSTSDRFLSWGWGGRKVEAFGVLKPLLRSSSHPAHLTLLLRDELRGELAVDTGWTNAKYIARIVTLLQVLGERKIATQVRFHSSHWAQLEEATQSVIAAHPAILSVAPKTPLQRQLRSGGAALFTYDSTGMLELATSGGGFLCFPADGIGHVREAFSLNYRHLASAGILSEDAELIASAGQRILKHGFSNKDKKAIRLFSEGIAFRRRNRAAAMAKFLRRRLSEA